MTLERLVTAATIRHARSRTERRGQAAFNAVHVLAPWVANAIRGTDADPFHDDSLLPDFWQRVAEVLDGSPC